VCVPNALRRLVGGISRERRIDATDPVADVAASLYSYPSESAPQRGAEKGAVATEG
jgi:hypothetical protein